MKKRKYIFKGPGKVEKEGWVVFVVLQCKLWQGWWLGLMQVSRKMIDETKARQY